MCGWSAVRRISVAGPWFVGRPRVAVATATVMMAAAFALGLWTADVADAAFMLFALPISLLAAAFGLLGGLISGAVGVGLVVAWARIDHVSLSILGWASRLGPLLLLGFLLGDAMDRRRQAEVARARLEDVARRHRDAVQLNDTIVQSLSAAKWALEGGDLEVGLEIVTQTLYQSNRLVSDLIRGAELGALWMGAPAREP
jgi:hypothetical protein